MVYENNCYFVSSRGILKSCDIFCMDPNSSDNRIINYNSELTNNDNYKTIYICNTAIPNFINNYSININYKYILVSGDCDETVPNNIFESLDNFLNFINNDNLLHWYSQNCIINHSKVTRMPIGLDYHSMSKCSNDWGPQTLPIKQEETLMEIINSNIEKPFWKRQIKCYSNFHFSMPDFYRFQYDRIDAINKVPKELVFYEENKISRYDTFKNQSEYAFVLSPHGNGLDCHRTWEALILGSIPIVRSSGIDTLYDDLPVLIVNEWSDITYELLENTITQFKNKQFNYYKITLKYWVEKINSHKIVK